MQKIDDHFVFRQEKSREIRVDKTTRETKNVPTVAGKVKIEIATGTTITTASGDMIDPSLIDILPIDGSKTLQAKSLYEKKMRNR